MINKNVLSLKLYFELQQNNQITNNVYPRIRLLPENMYTGKKKDYNIGIGTYLRQYKTNNRLAQNIK